MAADVLTDTLTVEYGGESYVFRVPSPMEYGSIALRARALRVTAQGQSAMSETGLDRFTSDMFRGMALFELQLKQASAKWPFTEQGGRVVVDSSKFPSKALYALVNVYAEFDTQLANFLQDGSGDAKPDGTEDLASKPDPSPVPVQ